MKTYAEQQGQQPFDWNEALRNPPKVNTIKHGRMARRAKKWVTCACGNQCAVIPRDWLGIPHDSQLSTRGREFFNAINIADWPSAKRILAQIEERSAEIINSMNHAKTN